MKSDKMLVAGLCGVIAVILHEIFGRILIFFGIGKYSVFQLSSFVITIDRPSGTIGLVTASLVAITIALLYYVALKIFGFNYVMIKGIFAGLFGWVFKDQVFYGILIETSPCHAFKLIIWIGKIYEQKII